jgi:hypothetical protein
MVVILLVSILTSSRCQTVHHHDEFIDVGIRLAGGNNDALLADLIAEENNIFNAGHVSCRQVDRRRHVPMKFRFTASICIIFVFVDMQVADRNERSRISSTI